MVKPSRLGRVKSGGIPVAFSATSNTASGAGAGLIFGVAHSDGSASTQVQLMDLNGDRYPDIVTNGGRLPERCPQQGLQ